MGVHQWNITVRQLENYLFYQYVGFIVWIILTLLLKIAILLQYLRIFVPDGIRGFTFWASHIVLWANVTYYTAFVFTFLFVCNPRPFFWDKTIAHGKCLDIFGINIIGAVFCLASDLIILLLPQRVIFRLTLSRTRKLSLAFLFAVGIFACITSAVRLYYNVRLWKNQTDVTYQLGFISLWGTVQLAAGFWIVCSPSIPKTINHFRGKPWFLRVETSLRSRLRKGHPKTEEGDLAQNPTIGGERNQRAGREVVTDVEFHELVNKTEASVASRADSGPV
ncbi:hypothetical protein SLS60_011133 [Paraconiothyrium brasiliense]|uniref:Rhodopsin domain-containing protein n=1 Tax=Paraconiothyrium brasiliense TaxID=300254 RepID=A0ABR3QKN9_9PLEO